MRRALPALLALAALGSLALAPAAGAAGCEPAPPSCNGPPKVCTTNADCPGAYTCTDNGTGTLYCVGAVCTDDAQCSDGGICRQYCTIDGCGPRRCQCPGFGCVGQDVLCIDNGGSLACRMICTQDSDCVDPFGLVCVNPGFGFGVCIGNTPCQ
jgi:hypothetical protein